MALALPRFAAIQSSFHPTKYLRYLVEDGQRHGFLQFTKSSSDSSLVAAADEPEEDQSHCSCTLFEPILVGGSSTNTTTVQLRHVQLGGYITSVVLLGNTSAPPPQSLLALPPSVSINNPDVFGIVDWESLLILPQHIAFKGGNDLYLSARWIERHKYLQFASSDYGDPTVGNEVFITNDGSVRIKNNHFGKFWRRSPNWIWADSDDSTTNNSDTLFSPVKVGDNIVALRNLGNNNFCKRLTTEGKTSCLNAGETTISTFARLVVEELVISREIYNVNFRLLDARIYNQNIITFASSSAENNKQVSDTKTLGFSHKDSRSSTWNGSVSLKLGVTTKIQTGIPFVAQGKVEVSTEFTGAYEWGETVTTENEVRTEYTTTVPPMSKVTISLLATQGSCDVPFSYTQRDTLMNGNTVINNLDDGLYTGINNFNFFYQTKQEEL
ncbi:hypothetical protein RHSIM_Rhsim07G0026400 [Rhododendron simsii]|uniref:Agglutinin domain-containing protein n=1 Tax=Rhododendron simsii TaxID=118357 RepID=A0A834LK33_RHOSS|nr:hypothetical protein RHSIM_Rhsim07G0026400 [Rhododendron simsii]